MGMGNAPVIILREGTKREKGKDAQMNNISAAVAISGAVKSSLGPRGMDKMLVDSMGDVIITNDGVTILKEMDVQHPAAKMLVEVAKTQDAEVGDGTTTSVVLAGELLKKATDLIDANVHPTIIAKGYRMANEKAQEILEKTAMKVTIDDEKTLKLIAETAMISKQVNQSREYFADLVVDAVNVSVIELKFPDRNGMLTETVFCIKSHRFHSFRDIIETHTVHIPGRQTVDINAPHSKQFF